MPKIDEGGYPYNSLSQSLKVGAAVKDHGGRNVPRSLIAESLSMSQKSSGTWAIISSAKSFGIVAGTREMSLTDAGRRYFYATSEAEQRLALLTFIASPPKFRALLDSHDGSGLPSMVMLTNSLKKAGLAGSWAQRAASMFVSALREANVIDEGNIVRYSAALAKVQRAVDGSAGGQQGNGYNAPPDEDAPQSQSPSRPMQTHPTLSESQQPASTAGKTVWHYGGGAYRVESPEPLSRAMWQKLKQYVELLEPIDDAQQGGSTSGSK